MLGALGCITPELLSKYSGVSVSTCAPTYSLHMESFGVLCPHHSLSALSLYQLQEENCLTSVAQKYKPRLHG